jgi:predicted DNA-binding transcriptional regulator AlpA
MTTRLRGVPDVATELGASEEWVRRQCRAGRFPHHRIARRLRFTDADVAAILADMAVPARPAPLVSVPGDMPARVVNRRYAVYPAPQQ